MARPKHSVGIFRLKPRAASVFECESNEALEKFTIVTLANKRLAEIRADEKEAGRDPYLVVLLPLSEKGGPLLPPGA